MTGEEIVALSKKHTLFEWAAQGAVDPIPVARAKGVYFWTPEGKRFIDFNSQLMSVNIGHGDERVIAAIQAQAQQLLPRRPGMATEPRARLGAKLAELTPGRHRRLLLHERRRRGKRERVQDRARSSPAGRRSWRAIARTTAPPAASITATGDPRRWSQAPLSGHHPRPRPVSRHPARVGFGRTVAALPRGSHPARRPVRRSRRSFWSP